MNKKYLILLMTVFLLASCGDKQVVDDGGVEVPSEVIDTINEESEKIDTDTQSEVMEENSDDEDSEESSEPEVAEAPAPEEAESPAEASESVQETQIPEETSSETQDTPSPSDANEEQNEEATQEPAPEDDSAATAPEASETKVIELTETYSSPGGDEQVRFTINLSDGTIEDVSVTNLESSDVGTKRIASFSRSINASVAGKTIAEAKVIGVVGGSSLTTGAFKEALKDVQ